MSDVWQKAKSILSAVAPTLGTALGGPLGGMAARQLASILLGDENASEADIADAVTRATPDQLLELKKADFAFKEKMAELDVDLERIASADRDSARNREIQTKDKMPGLLALGVFVGFFGILTALMFVEMPSSAKDPLMIMLGALGALVSQIANYFYGSSSGSATKTKMLDRIMSPTGTTNGR
ncbi:MAG: hypothetical protein GC184_14725 [Rhizobiales bacterium]|nr:hypothetical protein [Hyphomicrobiales bacterium]